MPHSLRARLSGLRYKKIISDKDYDRLCKALDDENVLDKIRDEITEYAIPDFEYHGCGGSQKIVELEDVLEIIDKYKEKKENE